MVTTRIADVAIQCVAVNHPFVDAGSLLADVNSQPAVANKQRAAVSSRRAVATPVDHPTVVVMVEAMGAGTGRIWRGLTIATSAIQSIKRWTR